MRTLLRKRSLYFLMATAMVISMTGCSAKSSADTENTTAEAETEIETEEETEEETLDSSGNDPSGNDVSDNDVSENDDEEETEDKTEDSPESKTNAASESEEEEEIEEESTNSKTSEKDSTKSETTTSETTTEAVTVQSVSAVVNGTHYVGETLTGADFTVTVTMSDGSTLTNPAGWSASPLTLSSTSNMLTVSYQGASTTVTVPASVQTASSSGSTSGGSTATSGSGTTSASGSGASSAASATQGTTETTTTAETTTASATEPVFVEIEYDYICDDGDWSYEYALALFDAQNDLRAEIGLDDLIWDDELYEVAKNCAKACGVAGLIDHTLTAPYRPRTIVYNSNGDTLDTTYTENLEIEAALYAGSDLEWEAYMSLQAIKNSPGHYKVIQEANYKRTAIAVYRKGSTFYISYIFCDDDEIYWVD